jgi:ATP-binding cassette subfamily F protein uup
MHYCSVENLTKSFGARVLFTDITFHISEGDKIALVARNGSGKSTLLNILTKVDTPDNGTVWIHKDIKTILLSQQHEFQKGITIRNHLLNMDHPVANVVKEYEIYLSSKQDDDDKMQHLLSEMERLDAWNFENNFQQILSKLNIINLDVSVDTLSGGQKKRVALAQSLLEAELCNGKCILIMDEPTNHLDVGMIEWLEQYLNTQKTTLLLVTHDRYFLDNVCNNIIEIENKKSFAYKGNYNYYLEQKAMRIEVEQSELQKDKNIYRKELEWMRKQPKARTTKSKSRQDNFVDVEDRVKKKEVDTNVSLQVKMTRLGGKILELKKIHHSFGDLKILNGFDHTFKRGERVGIVGKNGVGKSTFLKIGLGLLEPDSGKVNHGETVVFGHFSQDGLEYKEDKRVIEYVKDFAEFFPMADGTKLSASKFLETFAFTSEQQYTYLSNLSGGEKRRLQLLSILFKNPNFLILDEPTNDLDLTTLAILEDFLQAYTGCLLLVSHDRYFMDKIVDHLFVFEGDAVISDFPGNYTLYRIAEDKKAADKKAGIVEKEIVKPVEVIIEKSTPKEKRKLSFKEKFEFETIEKEMPLLETEKKALENKLLTTTNFEEVNKMLVRIGEITASLEEKEMRWLELSEVN